MVPLFKNGKHSFMPPKGKHPVTVMTLGDLEAHPSSQHALHRASGAREDNHLPGTVPGCNSLFKELLARRAARAGHILLASTHQAAICDQKSLPILNWIWFQANEMVPCHSLADRVVSQGIDSSYRKGI